MSIFLGELKKLWNWRTVAIIIAVGVLVFFAFLYQVIKNYNGFTGPYGPHQEEMFDRYGDTLEPEELADFDIPGRIANLEKQASAIIAGDPIFAQYGVRTVSDLHELIVFDDSRSAAEQEQFLKDYDHMMYKLYDDTVAIANVSGSDVLVRTQRPSGAYIGVGYHLEYLNALKNRYAPGADSVVHRFQITDYDGSSVVRRHARQLFESRDTNPHSMNLIRIDTTRYFAVYACTVAVFALIVVFVLIAPLVTADRTRRLHYLQYASAIGRKIFKIQFLAVTFSSLAITVALIALSYAAFFMFTTAEKFLGASIADFDGWTFYMYDITFGQYVLALAGMTAALCVGASCLAFALSRFSANIVTMLIKSVPAALALVLLAIFAINYSFSDQNSIFIRVFRREAELPEVVVCAALALIAVLIAVVVVRREKRVDVA
ncbi:MAG: hypothetical protein LBQ21_04825 [Clostridiales Family XIII bacterium]|nr:hypothetical protein [Clostridiales Family XIII bacterium]